MSNWNELLKGLDALEMQYLVEFGEEKLNELHYNVHVTRSEYPDEYHDFDEDGNMYAITFDMSLYMAMTCRLNATIKPEPSLEEDDLPF